MGSWHPAVSDLWEPLLPLHCGALPHLRGSPGQDGKEQIWVCTKFQGSIR